MWFSFLLLSTTARVITVVKICCELTWLRLVSPQHFDYCDDATLNRIRFVFFFFTTVSTNEGNAFFGARAWKRYWVTHWREQRCLDCYRQLQISHSDCQISRNCGKNNKYCPSEMFLLLGVNFSTYTASRDFLQARLDSEVNNKFQHIYTASRDFLQARLDSELEILVIP